jgi:hypothetical protein
MNQNGGELVHHGVKSGEQKIPEKIRGFSVAQKIVLRCKKIRGMVTGFEREKQPIVIVASEKVIQAGPETDKDENRQQAIAKR